MRNRIKSIIKQDIQTLRDLEKKLDMSLECNFRNVDLLKKQIETVRSNMLRLLKLSNHVRRS